MINSGNTLEVCVTNFNTNNNSAELLPPGMVPFDKQFSPTTQPASQLPQDSARRFFSKKSVVEPVVNQYNYAPNPNTARTSNSSTSKTKDTISQETMDRVKVQHLQTHANLQNNRWSYHTFCNLSADAEQQIPNNNNNNNNNINNNNKSAFFNCYNVDMNRADTFVDVEKTNNINNDIQLRRIVANSAQLTADNSAIVRDRRSSPIHRTEDQENAFRRIEDVHNYAKLNRYSYSNGSSHSSVHDEEDDDEEEEEEEDEGEEIEQNVDNDFTDNKAYLDTNYEIYIKHKRQHQPAEQLKKYNGLHLENERKTYTRAQETEAHVDVETLAGEPYELETPIIVTPDHHARRPMNAFLIFCKRHRAIVKDRYKSLENRAITKILGDWWASLDGNDKKSFTNLAQQNKDAFFSANPNFKWYKLPAPPLRTLNTRPSNSNERVLDSVESQVDQAYCNTTSLPLGSGKKTKSGNYFKFADEAQMGELSSLMEGGGIPDKCSNMITQQALQQALGETTQFLSTHMPTVHSLELSQMVHITSENKRNYKRRLQSDNSVSSNSSEDDCVPKKASRSCKGKIYQELVNSGQIAAIAKKIKTPKVQSFFVSEREQSGRIRPETLMIAQNPDITIQRSSSALVGEITAIDAAKRTASESDNYELINFDLEEKIKELPALSLDTYLQRKRVTKKKKKLNTKKRTSNSSSTSSSTKSSPTVLHGPQQPLIISPQVKAAVGSQKRKARKESITRRDVSAIANEVASLMSTEFTTINGCYYFDETPICPADTSLTTASTFTAPLAGTANISTKLYDQSNASNVLGNFSDNISSTSDLLILAEVAANRTEITK